MRKFAGLLAVAVAVSGLAAVPAMGQTPVTVFTSKATISPKKAGTKKHPQGIKISGSLSVKTITPGVEPPIVTGGSVLLPKYGKYNGGKYKTCSKKTLDRTQDPSKCPKGSIMGSGSGHAFADTVDATPKIVFLNGGASKIWAFTTLYHPALVQEPIALNIKKLSGSKWGYRVTFKVPKVLQIVAGVPVTLRSFKYKIGGKSYAKDFIVTTGCPKSHKYPVQGTADYLYSDGTTATSKPFTSTTACS